MRLTSYTGDVYFIYMKCILCICDSNYFCLHHALKADGFRFQVSYFEL